MECTVGLSMIKALSLPEHLLLAATAAIVLVGRLTTRALSLIG
jgi:hypothetical protein